MKKVVFLVILATLGVALLVASVAAQDGYVSDPGSQGLVVGTVDDDAATTSDGVVTPNPAPASSRSNASVTINNPTRVVNHYQTKVIRGRTVRVRVPARTIVREKIIKVVTVQAPRKPAKSPVVSGLTPTKDKSDWNWGWLLWPLLVLFALWLLWKLIPWFKKLFQPKPKSLIKNTADCNAFGVEQDGAEIEIISTGQSCIEVKKGVAFSDDDGDWNWVVPGEKLTVSSDAGAPIRFIVTCHNKAGLPVKTDSIVIKDTFASSLARPYRVTKGSFYNGSEKISDMSQKDIEIITRGHAFPLSNYIDELPANGSFSFIYEAEIVRTHATPLPNGSVPPPAQFTAQSPAADATKKLTNEAKIANDIKVPDAVDEAAKKAKKADYVPLKVPPMVSNEKSSVVAPSAADLAAAAKKGTV